MQTTKKQHFTVLIFCESNLSNLSHPIPSLHGFDRYISLPSLSYHFKTSFGGKVYYRWAWSRVRTFWIRNLSIINYSIQHVP